ncbi:30S ribosomal protein S6 [bacterium]|nr:30S ribosomal protein S6 [bacterium]
MSKTKPSGLGHYEVLFIIPNKYTEDEAKEIIKEVQKIIEKFSGIITYEEFWGKKKLAYPIQHNHFGYYQLFRFDSERNELHEINETLRLFEKTIRHQIVKVKKMTTEEILEQKKKQEELSKKEKKQNEEKKAPNTKAPVKKNIETVEEKNDEIVEEKPKKTKEEKEKIKKDDSKSDLKDLDDKLQGILEAKDLIK